MILVTNSYCYCRRPAENFANDRGLGLRDERKPRLYSRLALLAINRCPLTVKFHRITQNYNKTLCGRR
jgi:hypothetical protein